MEHGASVISLFVVFLAAFLTPIILHKLKLNIIPVVVAEILMGIIIGKSGFNLVETDMWLETLSTLGFIFLMFLSGLEIDFKAFTGNAKRMRLPSGKLEPNTFAVSFLIFGGIFIVSLILSYLFVLAGFVDNVFLMTLIISTISLGVVVPTLKEAHLMKTAIGQIILLVAVIADLVTMILLAVFVSTHEEGGNTWLLLILFAAGVLLYFLLKQFNNQTFLESMSTGTIQIGTRGVFTLIIVLVAISETVGAENILGAFLAGVLVSLLSPNPDLVHKLDSFGYGFLIPIFFVMIGVNLDIWALLQEEKLLLLIPFLLIALLISKLIPVYILKIWYDNRTVLASSFLLTSTLSLVIAAATIGERMGVITKEMSGMFILVAVITSIFTPIVFKKVFPFDNQQIKKTSVAIIGANQFTLSVYRGLQTGLYEATLYHTKQEKMTDSIFNIKELEDYSIETLNETYIHDADVVVITTGEENINAELGISFKEKGVERVICRAESPAIEEELRNNGIEVFSVLRSSQTLLQAMIEIPNVMEILTDSETSLYEITLFNSDYEGMTLREFPFTGDVIFVRIFRGKDSIVPHGETELNLYDRLIVTGTKEYVEELKQELQFVSYPKY
jgi:CPA2 family monovalent cation:H+ antiporter-2